MLLQNNRSFLNIPVHLCDFVIRNKSFAPFRFYIYLKSKCDGQVKMSFESKKQMAKELNISSRTIDNYLAALSARNWIGHNPCSGYYFIRGFNKVKEIEGLMGRRGAWLSVNKDILNARRFKAFVIGVSVGHLVNTNKWKERCKRGSEHFKGSSKHNSCKHLPSHYPMACEAMAKIFGMSTSTASLYKATAHNYGFVQVKKNLKKIILGEEEQGLSESVYHGDGIDARFVGMYKSAFPEKAHRVRIKHGKLFLENPDLLLSCLEFSKRWRSQKGRELRLGKKHSN